VKRPEGFDPSARPEREPESRPDPSRAGGVDDDPTLSTGLRSRIASLRLPGSLASRPDRGSPPETSPTGPEEARVDSAAEPTDLDAPAAGPGSGPARPAEPVRLATVDTSRDEARRRALEARRASRRASRQRRRVERLEVRRFTRRSRHRRATWIAAAVVALLLGASVGVAVFSPLLSLQTITVDGADRVDAAAVQEAVDDQIGTPLARIDFDRITRELEAFPLIASYVTETAPPHTLVIRITERQPIATVADGDAFDLVDPAGIVVQSLDARPEGVPSVDVAGAPLDGTAFRASAEVLLALPAALRSTVDQVTASTADDVTLTLTTGQRVMWGSAEHSDRKAEVLAGLMADQASRDAGASVEYDVSAPDNGIIRPI
jgi:cell division protein FtsQ